MLPGDGLPAQVCCMCADKLESAYEFKLQVEQADIVLKERLVGGIIKEELFLNEVEIDLDDEQNDTANETIDSDNYDDCTVEVLTEQSSTNTNFLKDELTISPEKFTNAKEEQQSE